MSIIRFDNPDHSFDSNLLSLEPIEEIKSEHSHYFKVPIKYNGGKLKIRLPKMYLKGIYCNTNLNTFSLFYPYPGENESLTEELTMFKKWINLFEHHLRELVFESVKNCKLKNKIFKEILNDRNSFAPLFQETKNGRNMFIRFSSTDSIMKQKCFSFSGEERNINEECAFGREGDYLVIVDMPSVYITCNNKTKHKAIIQIFGNTVFAQTELKPNPKFDVKDLLGNEFLY